MTSGKVAYVGFSGLLVVSAGAAAAVLEWEECVLIFPALAIIGIAVTLVAMLGRRDGSPPYFDLGVFCVLVTSLYLVYPLFAFLFSGMVWTELSDSRLVVYSPTPAEFSQVAWWGVLYVASLSAAYAAVRKRPVAKFTVPLTTPAKSTIVAMVFLFGCAWVYTQSVQIFFDVDLNPSYGVQGAPVADLPLVVQQVTSKVTWIGIVLQFGLILLLTSHSQISVWRWTLWLWAILQVVSVLVVFGARYQAVLFLVAWLLAQQRLRPPLHPMLFLGACVLILGGALAYGFLRGTGTGAETVQMAFSASSEFQAMYGTVYNLIFLRDTGGLPSIPSQMYFADLLRLIPQQLLPFEKVDPGDWYLDLIGARGTGQGFMFGVISEAAVGLGAIEMLFRGLVLGVIFGKIHNWYVKNASSFWSTLFYLWLCVRSYYTYRASTFYLLAEFVLVFIPTYLLVRILGDVIGQATSNRFRVTAATK